MDDIREQLDRIEQKVGLLLSGPQSPTVTIEEAMTMTASGSRAALYRLLERLNVKPYDRGKYRREDIYNAMGRQALQRTKAAKNAAKSEEKTEAQRHSKNRPNPHDD